MTAQHWATLMTAMFWIGISLSAIALVCYLIARRLEKQREAWLRRWNILDINSKRTTR